MKLDGIVEDESEVEYAPSGFVSFLTIHKSKGLQFPIVIVGSLDRKPNLETETEIEAEPA